MASRLARFRKPLIAAAAVAAGGAVTLTLVNKPKRRELPTLKLQRDSDGRVIPPKFAPVRSRPEQVADLRRHGSASTEYDLLVIGGGATGTGIALDAATRGLKVALVERDDFSSGTSSKSTKLVHGGVRYLEKAVWNLDLQQLALVIEALAERKTFLDIAPHLSLSLPIMLPLKKWWQAPYFWAGTKAYDLLAGSQGLESSYVMTKSKALEAFPLLQKKSLVGALVYYDGQHNDSRMNIALAMTAAACGATVANHVEVTGLEKDSSGKICGARVRDTLTGPGDNKQETSSEFTVRAKGVINATGPFTDAIEKMDDPSRKDLVAPSSGAHVMLPPRLCPKDMGVLEVATSDGRLVFVLPWQGYALAGTTDNACKVEQEPVSKESEVDFIMEEVGKLLAPEAKLSKSDILATWSGVRPLIRDPKAKNTESLVRNHLVTVSDSGLLTCAGGKWTTYRRMAEDAVDAAMKTFKLSPRRIPIPNICGETQSETADWFTDGKCQTRDLPLVGAHGYSPDLPNQLMHTYRGLDADIAHHLASNYGDRAWEVVAADSTRPQPHHHHHHGRFAPSRLRPGLPFVEAEIRYGVRHEAAQTAADILARRMRLAFLDVNAALDSLPRVIDVMAEELGWTDDRKTREWSNTVHFLRSMGLPDAKLGVTRDEVLKGLQTKGAARKHWNEMVSRGVVMGGGEAEIEAGKETAG